MRIGAPTINSPVTTDPHLKLLGDPTNASPNEGDFWYDGTSLNFRDSSQTIDLVAGGGNVFMAEFSRDMTIADGTQAITGVGFTPNRVFFMAGRSPAVGAASFGFDDISTINFMLANQHEDAANQWLQRSTRSIEITIGGGLRYTGDIQSFDSDGFTILWDQSGAMVGTIRAAFLAFG